MACICAKFNGEYYECNITGDSCSFYRPNQDACADMYGEVEHTKKWIETHKEGEADG